MPWTGTSIHREFCSAQRPIGTAFLSLDNHRLGPGGVVSGGDAFWAISTEAIPVGFVGPVVYGALLDTAIDESEANGAPVGCADLESDECHEFGFITTAFQTGSIPVEL